MPALGAPLNFSQYEAQNLRAHNLSANPGSPVKGQLYFNTTNNKLWWWDGGAWVDATGGATGGPPTGSAGGDLAGSTYPNPVIAALAVTAAKIANATITDVQVAAANKDGAVGTASMRTIGSLGTQAMAGNRTLALIASSNPTLGAIDVNGQQIKNGQDPSAASDFATKNYVDAVAQGLDAKPSVRYATAGANVPSLTGNLTIDGVVTAAGDRVLVKDQTNPQENGIYVAATGAWTRATDMDAWGEVNGAFTFVEGGLSLSSSGWVATGSLAGTIGTTPIVWTQFSGAGTITAGTGLTKTGSQIALTVPVALVNGGTGQTTAKAARETGLTAAGYYSSATHGAGTTITITQATHGLRSSRGIHVQVQDETTGAVELPDCVVAANGDVTVTYGVSLSANTKRVTLVG